MFTFGCAQARRLELACGQLNKECGVDSPTEVAAEHEQKSKLTFCPLEKPAQSDLVKLIICFTRCRIKGVI
jgi:hypothetical protein